MRRFSPNRARLLAAALAIAVACPSSASALRPMPDRTGLEEALRQTGIAADFLPVADALEQAERAFPRSKVIAGLAAQIHRELTAWPSDDLRFAEQWWLPIRLAAREIIELADPRARHWGHGRLPEVRRELQWLAAQLPVARDTFHTAPREPATGIPLIGPYVARWPALREQVSAAATLRFLDPWPATPVVTKDQAFVTAAIARIQATDPAKVAEIQQAVKILRLADLSRMAMVATLSPAPGWVILRWPFPAQATETETVDALAAAIIQGAETSRWRMDRTGTGLFRPHPQMGALQHPFLERRLREARSRLVATQFLLAAAASLPGEAARRRRATELSAAVSALSTTFTELQSSGVLTPDGIGVVHRLQIELDALASDLKAFAASGGLEEGKTPTPSGEPKDGLTWFANLIERAADRAGTVQVSRRRFLRAAAATAQMVGASALLPKLEAAVPNAPTVAIPADVATDVWVGYLTPDHLTLLEQWDRLRKLALMGSPPVMRAHAPGAREEVAGYLAREGFEFLEDARQLPGGVLTLDAAEWPILRAFFSNPANHPLFRNHPAVRRFLQRHPSYGGDAQTLFYQIDEWLGHTAPPTPAALSAELAASPETAHLAWRVQRVLEGDVAFLDHDPWFQAERTYWQEWEARNQAMGRVLQDDPNAQSRNTEIWQKAQADFKAWDQRHQAERQDEDALVRPLRGPFTAAPGDGLPTREAAVAEVAEQLTAEPARYRVFTAALDRLGPAMDAQALAMLCGRLLLAWTDPAMTIREDVARRLATLIVALPPEEIGRRRARLRADLHDLQNGLSDVIGYVTLAEDNGGLAQSPTLSTAVRWKHALESRAFQPVYDRWVDAAGTRDVAGTFTQGALLTSEYYGVLRRFVEEWLEMSSEPGALPVTGTQAVRKALTYGRWRIPQTRELARVTLDDLAGLPHPIGPLDLTRLVQELAPRWGWRYGVRSMVVTAPPQPQWVVANPVDVERAVGNLVTNAAEALKRAGGAQDGRIELILAREGPWATLTVQDNGPGLPDAVLTLVNQPALAERVPSAKPSGTPGQHGLGLLSVKRRVVEDWGGQFEVRRRPDGGAEIILRLPAIEPPPDAGLEEEHAGLDQLLDRAIAVYPYSAEIHKAVATLRADLAPLTPDARAFVEQWAPIVDARQVLWDELAGKPAPMDAASFRPSLEWLNQHVALARSAFFTAPRVPGTTIALVGQYPLEGDHLLAAAILVQLWSISEYRTTPGYPVTVEEQASIAELFALVQTTDPEAYARLIRRLRVLYLNQTIHRTPEGRPVVDATAHQECPGWIDMAWPYPSQPTHLETLDHAAGTLLHEADHHQWYAEYHPADLIRDPAFRFRKTQQSPLVGFLPVGAPALDPWDYLLEVRGYLATARWLLQRAAVLREPEERLRRRTMVAGVLKRLNVTLDVLETVVGRGVLTGRGEALVRQFRGQLDALNTLIVFEFAPIWPIAPSPGLEEPDVGAAAEPALRDRWAVETLGVEA